MKKTNKTVLFICRGALIAAVYTVLTHLANAMGLANGAIQFRISEALCALGVFTPAAIPGVALGCFLSNLTTGCAIWDIIFGSLASLIGMIGLRALKKHPVLAPLPYVAANVIIVPFVLRYAYGDAHALPYLALTVGIGEVVCAWILGVALWLLLKKTKADKLFYDQPQGNK